MIKNDLKMIKKIKKIIKNDFLFLISFIQNKEGI